MKTPLNELKQEILDMRFDAHVNGLDEFKNALNQVINRIDSKFESEKKVIMDATIYGANNDWGFCEEDAEKYYNENFDKAPEMPHKSEEKITAPETSLSKVIKTQEQGDDFMRQLRSLSCPHCNPKKKKE